MSPSQITLGLWPLAGVTTVGVTDRERDETMMAAIESGICRFDTAYCYGLDGESDELVRRHLAAEPDRYQIVSKVGQRYEDGKRVVRCDRETLRRDAQTCLERCGLQSFDTLLLHAVDSNVPISESAETMRQFQNEGICRNVGLCNADMTEMSRFMDHCDLSVTQCGLNVLQPNALETFIPWCQNHQINVDVFWTLMKGLLAGGIRRGHTFAEGDSRVNYDIFHGSAFERAQCLVDQLDRISSETGLSIAELSIGWAMSQTGVQNVLVGARTPNQVAQIAAARSLSPEILHRVGI